MEASTTAYTDIAVLVQGFTEEVTHQVTHPFMDVLANIIMEASTTAYTDIAVSVQGFTEEVTHQVTHPCMDVGAASISNGSFEAILGGVIIAVLLALFCLALPVIVHNIVKQKGTYHTNEAECGDSVDTSGDASQSELFQLEMMNEEE